MARFKLHTLLSLLLFLNFHQIILAQGLISKLKSNSPATANDNANGQSTRENQWEINRPGENWVVAEDISCWEQNGRWENEQSCPNSTIVTAHRFRHLSRTGLTGIELKCTEKYEPDQSQSQSEHILLINFEGQVEKDLPRGKWESWKNGSRSAFAQGFSFNRGELSLGRSVKNYDVIYHSGNEKQSTVDSDFVLRKCPEDHAICGVTAMMDKAGLGILTAIGLRCCHHCVPEEKWVTVYEYDNSSPFLDKKEISAAVGVDLRQSLQNGMYYSVNLRNKMDSTIFEGIFARFGKSNSTGFDWSVTLFSIWTKKSPITETFPCERQSSCVYKQLVGQCGVVHVPVAKFCRVSVPIGSSIPDSCNFHNALELKYITSCSDAMEIFPSPRSKKQRIHPHGNGTSLKVICDFETDGGGWTIIQKRSSGPKYEFAENWNEYVNGFGSVSGNFWLGLENIHALTKNGGQELRIELEDFEGEKKYAKYSSFSISDDFDFYQLTISGFSGDSTLNDSMVWHHNGQKFSTMDKDNDFTPYANCAATYGGGGGWWFHSCSASNLNGLYFEKGETVPLKQGILWYHWKGSRYSLAKTEMKIRSRKP